MNEDARTYEGQCFCGGVTIEVTGDPEGAGYCHCAACRSWSASPVNAFTLWKSEAVKVTQGEDQLVEYHNNERSYREWCKVCARGARQLRVDRAAHERRPPEAQGLPRRAGRLRRDARRVATRPAGGFDGSGRGQ